MEALRLSKQISDVQEPSEKLCKIFEFQDPQFLEVYKTIDDHFTNPQ